MTSNPSIKIGSTLVGPDHPPFIIAEMSGNHNQSLERALSLVDIAADSGANAIKLQTYTPDTITLDVNTSDFQVRDSSNLWHGESLSSLYHKAHTPWEWHEKIFEHASSRNLLCFSSPFDETAVDFLETLHAPAYKIASFENNHLPLIKKAAATGKPLIISTGMATVEELSRSVQAARDAGCQDLVLLKCTSSYPATPLDSNLRTIPHLRDLFGCHVGLSDHTMGCGVPAAAVAFGACVVEKHFTISRADGGVDSSFSLEPSELTLLVEETHRAWQSLGNIAYGPAPSEVANVKYRRSIYISANIQPGDVFSMQNLKVIRPGNGLDPALLDLVLGRKCTAACKKGTPLKWSLID